MLFALTDACFVLQIQSIVPAVLLDLLRVIGGDRYETKYRSEISADISSADISLSVLGPPYLTAVKWGRKAAREGERELRRYSANSCARSISLASLLQARRVKTACAASCSSDDSRLQGVLQEPEAFR
jgi:hypothetical protein